MSTNLQSIVLAGISPSGLAHGGGHWPGFVSDEPAPDKTPVLRIDIPEADVSEADASEAADETAEPVDSSTSPAPEETSSEGIRGQAVADIADSGLLETILQGKDVKVEVTVCPPDSSAQRSSAQRSSEQRSSEHGDLRLDDPKGEQHPLIPKDRSVDLSAFTSGEEDLLRRCLKRSLPPAYVDAVIRIVSRSREEMIEDLESCLGQRTQQLHQAVSVIQNLMREKNELQGKVVRLDQMRGNLDKIHATLKGVHHEISDRETTG